MTIKADDIATLVELFEASNWDELHVEIDGLAHMWVTTWLADLTRSNELAIGTSATRLRFAGFQLIEQEDEVFAQVVRALVAGGWTR